MEYTETQWSSVKDKERFEKQFKKFVEGGYQRKHFPKWFYRRLSMTFGFIAHYDIHGFYATYFEFGEKGIQDFERMVRNWTCYGDADCTYSDVEKVLRAWMQERMRRN